MGSRVSIIGNVNIDVIMGPLAGMPELGQEITVKEHKTRVAGAAGNTALALAALGAPPYVVSMLGDDPAGKEIIATFKAKGICTDGLGIVTGRPSGVSYGFFAKNGERAFVTFMGALKEFSFQNIYAHYHKIFTSDYILITGYFLMPGVSYVEWNSFIRQLRKSGKVILLDCGWDPQGWETTTIEVLKNLIGLVDIFLPNLAELERLTGTSDPLAGAKSLLRSGVKEIVVKCGPHGSLYVREGEAVKCPAYNLGVFDTAGSGDVFNAGLLYMLPQVGQVAGSMSFANAVAALAISKKDRWYPSPEDVRGIMTSPNLMVHSDR